MQMPDQLKQLVEKYSGAPVGVPSDELNVYMAAVADVVYTDGKLDYEMFKQTVMNFVDMCPKEWRKGQSVFNVIDSIFGVAREVQFLCHVDCFYNDDAVDEFITKSYEQYWEHIRRGDFVEDGGKENV